MSKQTDLESKFMGCWNIIEDIEELNNYINNETCVDIDKVSNILLGLKELYSLRFDSCFLTFEEYIREQHNKVPR